MGCTGKIKGNCKKVEGSCVTFSGVTPSFSTLFEEECLSQEETIVDIYSILSDLKDELSFESLRGSCITYPTGTLQITDVLTAMQTIICQQQETITDMQATQATQQAAIEALQQNTCP